MVKLIDAPNPSYQPGDQSKAPLKLSMKSYDFSTLGVAEKYSLMVGAIVPRPIALVSTQDSNGNANVAPFSYFNGISSEPPIVMVSIARKPKGDKKDTLLNILETNEFVVNSSSAWSAEAIHQSSADYEASENEFEKVGLTELKSTHVKPPRVKESAVQMECKLVKTLDFGEGTAGSVTVVFGEILAMHVSEEICKDHMIMIDQYEPISRLGGPYYGLTNEIFPLPRAKK